MPRYFNTTGPCELHRNYVSAPLARVPEVNLYIERKQYFVLHAPRQTGKTTAMRTFAASLRERGIAGCWVTFEASQGVEDIADVEPLWLRALRQASSAMPPGRISSSACSAWMAGNVPSARSQCRCGPW